jgi:hypothetical protein
MNMRIGQVIFLIPQGKHSMIIPLQVKEELQRKTTAGVTTTYTVIHRDKTYDIADVKGEIFHSTRQLKKTLVERAQVKIEQLIEGAEKEAKLLYKQEEDEQTPQVETLSVIAPPEA